MQQSSTDETVLKTFVDQMIEAWNHGDAAGFAAPFAEDADFIAFEGTHLRGRAAIIGFHQPLFDTALKGTRLEGSVKFVRFVTPHLAWASLDARRRLMETTAKNVAAFLAGTPINVVG